MNAEHLLGCLAGLGTWSNVKRLVECRDDGVGVENALSVTLSGLSPGGEMHNAACEVAARSTTSPMNACMNIPQQ
uniref:Uncharacterized protein n=1 Tax=Parascaris equorum TaxID=6256 RepID=A0A914RA88_PAREQ